MAASDRSTPTGTNNEQRTAGTLIIPLPGAATTPVVQGRRPGRRPKIVVRLADVRAARTAVNPEHVRIVELFRRLSERAKRGEIHAVDVDVTDADGVQTLRLDDRAALPRALKKLSDQAAAGKFTTVAAHAIDACGQMLRLGDVLESVWKEA